MPKTKFRLCPLNPRACVGHGNLKLIPSEVEVAVSESPLRHVEDCNLGITKVNRQLSMVTKAG